MSDTHTYAGCFLTNVANFFGQKERKVSYDRGLFFLFTVVCMYVNFICINNIFKGLDQVQQKFGIASSRWVLLVPNSNHHGMKFLFTSVELVNRK